MRLSSSRYLYICRLFLSTRNFIKGENLLNCDHLAYGIAEQTKNCFYLQISNMRDPPHQIKIILSMNGQINLAECTCKTGLSAKCKHIIAVLLFCNRKDIEELDQISCTDMKCV
ncbi:uncharacterized protein LOC105434181 [Pogonomyrmex barbatus]|uniref:Uncharacterized protein LOC105434181 n=1 Tax=Pogonomyrmex barbatus TaxID=144034 RepID=A0A6I9WV14_9HYME|nr:uncharacterized protein LOC105434181 [Pogonomyrmex barbatus]